MPPTTCTLAEDFRGLPNCADSVTFSRQPERRKFRRVALFAFFVVASPLFAQHDIALQFTPAQTEIHYTLDATFHTVHGVFRLQSGTIHFNPATGAISGEVVVDAASGDSGNSSRDRKMHQEVLESDHYREITFLPDRVDGILAPQGKSTIQVHGAFGVRGATHEITIPVQVGMASGRWTASAHFTIPYVQWGLKNPSTFLLHVGKTVDIDVQSSGAISPPRATK